MSFWSEKKLIIISIIINYKIKEEQNLRTYLHSIIHTYSLLYLNNKFLFIIH